MKNISSWITWTRYDEITFWFYRGDPGTRESWYCLRPAWRKGMLEGAFHANTIRRLCALAGHKVGKVVAICREARLIPITFAQQSSRCRRCSLIQKASQPRWYDSRALLCFDGAAARAALSKTWTMGIHIVDVCSTIVHTMAYLVHLSTVSAFVG